MLKVLFFHKLKTHFAQIMFHFAGILICYFFGRAELHKKTGNNIMAVIDLFRDLSAFIRKRYIAV